MAWINTAALRKDHPATWSEVWRIIKTDAPDYAESLKDPLLADMVERFGATINLQIEQLPERARALIPTHLIKQ